MATVGLHAYLEERRPTILRERFTMVDTPKPTSSHQNRFPNESAEYGRARNGLLEAEIALRRQIEAVAAQRRALPPGGEVPEDYIFEEGEMPARSVCRSCSRASRR